MPAPEQLAADILGRLGRLTDAIDRGLEDTAEDVRDIERGVTHVVSGDLKESLTVFGPFESGDTLEARIVPVDIDYAVEEAERGEAHSFAARGFESSAARMELFRRNMEIVLQRTVEG